MKRSWYSDMQRLGRKTGYGMRFVIRLKRSSAESKSAKRCAKCEGEPMPLLEGFDLMHTPILNKRTKKVLYYRVDIPKATQQ